MIKKLNNFVRILNKTKKFKFIKKLKTNWKRNINKKIKN